MKEIDIAKEILGFLKNAIGFEKDSQLIRVIKILKLRILSFGRKRPISHYQGLAESKAEEYLSAMPKDMDLLLNSFLVEYRACCEKGKEIGEGYLKRFEEIVAADSNRANKHTWTSGSFHLTYSEMLFSVLKCKHYPAHFCGFDYKHFDGYRNLDCYYELVNCLIAYDTRPMLAYASYQALENDRDKYRHYKECPFFFLVGAFLSRKNVDAKSAEAYLIDGLRSINNSAACKKCGARCNREFIQIELLRTQATLKRLKIDYSDIRIANDTFAESEKAFQAIITGFPAGIPEGEKIQADILFSYGYLMLVHHYRIAGFSKGYSLHFLLSARESFLKSLKNNPRFGAPASRCAIIEYSLGNHGAALSYAMMYLESFDLHLKAFSPSDIDVENRLNIIWVYYLVLIIKNGITRFRDPDILRANISRHIDEAVLAKEISNGTVECHSTDFAIIRGTYISSGGLENSEMRKITDLFSALFQERFSRNIESCIMPTPTR